MAVSRDRGFSAQTFGVGVSLVVAVVVGFGDVPVTTTGVAVAVVPSSQMVSVIAANTAGSRVVAGGGGEAHGGAVGTVRVRLDFGDGQNGVRSRSGADSQQRDE